MSDGYRYSFVESDPIPNVVDMRLEEMEVIIDILKVEKAEFIKDLEIELFGYSSVMVEQVKRIINKYKE